MRVEEINEQFLPLPEGAHYTPQVRSPGLHVSQIVKSICQELYPRRFGKAGEEEDFSWERMEMGFAWEEVLSQGLITRFNRVRSDIIMHPGEVEVDVDGTTIYMSPDGINLEEESVEEYKCTWASSFTRKIDDDFFAHWIWQTKAYCYGVGMEATIFRVLFINGDYRGSGPVVKTWRVEFTELEIEENWEMLCNAARSKGWL